jgi:tetratricopeptide (TPR) repeat protein
MAEEKTRKELLEEPDPVLIFMGQVFSTVKKYQQQIVMTVMGAFILIVVVFGIVYFQRQTEDKASAMLGQAMDQYNAMVRINANTVNPKEPSAAQYDEAKKSFKDIIDKYGSTGAGKAALLNYADICYQAKDYEESVKSYEKALNDFGGQPELRNLILNGLAYAYEGKQDLDNAAKYFDMIVSDKSTLVKDQALFNLAEIYDKQGKADKSKEAYQKIVSDYPNSMYFQPAKEKIGG